ncbi:hypothetical protein LSH36_995g01102 [Paralvinella palmiformis]|uniref:Uncharacterized protein n=1 Tax=Paralvinella palmiformis TaxID=53620 RepID=A0AAD9MSE6_9ANNE|nr:hypothetical protein LSH36_995g01102 [Paralvinella palmiformis]
MSCSEHCQYLWDWYYIWTVRSKILKAAAAMLIGAFILDLVALTSGYWLVGPHGYTGLFDGTVRGWTDKPVSIPVVCPILSVLSAVILFCDNILNLLFVTRQYYLVMPAVIVFAFIGALMLMTVIVTWSVPDITSGQRLSWSYIVASLAVVVDMVGCGLCVLDFLSRHSRARISSNDNRARTPATSPNEIQNLDPDLFSSAAEGDPGGGDGRIEEANNISTELTGEVEEFEMRTL